MPFDFKHEVLSIGRQTAPTLDLPRDQQDEASAVSERIGWEQSKLGAAAACAWVAAACAWVAKVRAQAT